MTEKIVRFVAGSIVVTSMALAYTQNIQWLWLGVFVGLNLMQSAFTGFCPLELLLKALGVKSRNGM